MEVAKIFATSIWNYTLRPNAIFSPKYFLLKGKIAKFARNNFHN